MSWAVRRDQVSRGAPFGQPGIAHGDIVAAGDRGNPLYRQFAPGRGKPILGPSGALKLASWLVAAAIVLTWFPVAGPLQVFSYGIPAGLIALSLMSGIAYLHRPDALLLLFIACLTSIVAMLSFPNAWLHIGLSFLTYSPIALLTLRFRNGTSLLPCALKTIAWLSIVEAGVGMLQFALAQGGFVFGQLAAGDVVVGTTFAKQSHLYALKMLFSGMILLFCWNYAREKKLREPSPRLLLVGALAAFVAGMFASFIIGTVLFVGAVSLWWLRLMAKGSDPKALNRAFRWAILVSVSVASLAALFVWTQPGNVALIERTLTQVNDLDFSDRARFQKMVVMGESIDEILLRSPKDLFFGMGLGLYSSRSAMILSGGYLYDHPDWIPQSMTRETEYYLYSVWNPRTWASYGGSSMAMPTSSLQSLLLEGGLVGSVLVIAFFVNLARQSNRQLRLLSAGPPTMHVPALQLVAGLMLGLLAVSITDVWIEHSALTSAIFLFMAVALSGQVQGASRATMSPHGRLQWRARNAARRVPPPANRTAGETG